MFIYRIYLNDKDFSSTYTHQGFHASGGAHCNLGYKVGINSKHSGHLGNTAVLLFTREGTVETRLSFVFCTSAWPTMSTEEFSYEEVQSGKIDALKKYCRRRNLKVGGRKA